jgi:predicted nucleic acid-binding protein
MLGRASKNNVAPIPVLVLDRSDYLAAARLHRRCAARGLSASTVDCQIAQAAIAHGCILLTADADFRFIEKVAPHLRLG